MSVECNASGTKYVKWTAPSGVVGLTAKSVLIWYYHLANQSGGAFFTINDGTGTDSDEYTQLVGGAGAATTLDFLASWTSGPGVWRPTTGFLTINTMFLVGFTYDGSSSANNAIAYVNGSSVSVTRIATPSGTFKTGTGSDFYIGSNGISGTTNPNGRIVSLCYYNRILSATEIADAYANKLAFPISRGLVFAPDLSGASGGVVDGSTLTSSNLITDIVSGARGTPNGSPVLRADTFLVRE